VQGRQRGQLAQGLLHVGVDHHGLAEALAAVHDPVPDGVRGPSSRMRVHDAAGVSTVGAKRQSRNLRV
jgi:hypothetical protein